METIRLNTIIFPPQHIREEAMELSKKAASFAPTHFILNDRSYFAHSTLYSPEYPLDRIDEVIESIRALSNSFKPQQMNFDAISSTSTGGIAVEYTLSRNVKRLRENVIHTLNPIRNDVVRKKYIHFETDNTLDSSQKESVRLYGYPINDYHFPHITISHFKEKKMAQKFLAEYDNALSPFLADKIAVCEMGLHGTCTKILGVFNLKT